MFKVTVYKLNIVGICSLFSVYCGQASRGWRGQESGENSGFSALTICIINEPFVNPSPSDGHVLLKVVAHRTLTKACYSNDNNNRIVK